MRRPLLHVLSAGGPGREPFRCRGFCPGPSPSTPRFLRHTRTSTMAKGQQKSNKEAKKPKKDASPAKPISAGAVMPSITTVVADRSKKKK